METEKQTKVCSRCKRELPLDNFNKSIKSPDGLQYMCRECQSDASRRHHEKAKILNESGDPTTNPLSAFKPRELIQELRNRGYHGKLTFTHTIEL